MAKVPFQPGERLLNRYRRSGFVLVKPLLLAVIVVAAPWYFLAKYGLWRDYAGLLYLWTVLVAFTTLRALFIWHLNQYLITDKRLVKIAHVGVFKKFVVETPLERILNVSYKTTGLGSVLGHFGDVEVQVVGLVEPIILERINYPARIKDYLWQLHKQHSHSDIQVDQGPVNRLQNRIGYTKHDQRIL